MLKQGRNLFWLVAACAAFLVSPIILGCSSDDDDGNAGNTEVVDVNRGADNKTDVAVTGAAYEHGVTYAKIYGYVNLDKLPNSVKASRFGVEISEKYDMLPPDYGGNVKDYMYKTADEVNASNQFSVTFDGLLPSTTYYYRTFVSGDDGIYRYGEVLNLTTDKLQNAVSSCILFDKTYATADFDLVLDHNLLPDVGKGISVSGYCGIEYSTNKEDLVSDENNAKEVYRSFSYSNENDLQNISDTMLMSLSDLQLSTTYYYRTYTQVLTHTNSKRVYGDVQEFTPKEINIATSGLVDLGLSVKWAACNLGASSPYDQGDTYQWGATSTYGSYYSGYEDNIIGTTRDAAYLANNDMCIPSLDNFNELIGECKLEESGNGVLVVGPNGNAIYMPYTYYWTGEQRYYGRNYCGVYFCIGSSGTYRNFWDFKDNIVYATGYLPKSSKSYIRPVGR